MGAWFSIFFIHEDQSGHSALAWDPQPKSSKTGPSTFWELGRSAKLQASTDSESPVNELPRGPVRRRNAALHDALCQVLDLFFLTRSTVMLPPYLPLPTSLLPTSLPFSSASFSPFSFQYPKFFHSSSLSISIYEIPKIHFLLFFLFVLGAPGSNHATSTQQRLLFSRIHTCLPHRTAM